MVRYNRRRGIWRPGAETPLLALVAFLSPAQASWAQDRSCDRYIGQRVNPVSFAQAVEPFSKLAPRSEFEGTTEYKARLARIVGNLPSPILVAKPSFDRNALQYDADAQKLMISRWLFGRNLRAFELQPYSSALYALSPSAFENVDIVLSDATRQVGAYAASNAFGVRATVKRIHVTTEAIYDRAGTREEQGLFAFSLEGPKYVGGISMSPSQARVAEATVSIAFAVVPKPPYLIKGSRLATAPSLELPERAEQNFSVLVADIQCALVLDANHIVLGAYTTG